MVMGFNDVARYRAILVRDKRYDGIFYFAKKSIGIYCRPSCSNPSPTQKDCHFFCAVEEAKSHGYQACKCCHPDRLKNGLWPKILGSINAGAINEKGVRGLAESLQISERHLRRVVHDRTGTSPIHLNQARRLRAARKLVAETDLPIIDVAFSAGFSSLRQFNAAFKSAFKISPCKMRKTATFIKQRQDDSRVAPLILSNTALLRGPLRSLANQ